MKPASRIVIPRRSFLKTTFAPLLLATFSPALTAAEFRIGTHNFTVPSGFEIERVAGNDLAPRPVSASFDDQGRLFVTDSSGSNLPPSEQLKNPTHRLLRLEDTDGDGRFDKSVVFADKVMFPQGCLWHAGSVYVAGPPSIWKFTDTDGDGMADKREEWFKGGTLTGCANDIHGPHLGPDGYLYWTKGAFDEQTHQLGDGRVLKDRAAHIYRARPDGSDLDVVMTGGMDNPVEVAFTAEGETVFTSTFIDFSQPGYRDGIGHAVLGSVFGKANSALDDGRVRRTGPELMQPFVQFGAGAPSGLCLYESGAFGEDYQNNLFASLFNLHKITRHRITPKGASYTSKDSDFVVSDNLDFHPTDVLPDADGSLIVIDTGGWYKLCCPSSQLAKEDVLGGIYRVHRSGGHRHTDPRGLKITWPTLEIGGLVKLLDDPRFAVRARAIAELAGRKTASVDALRQVLDRSDSEVAAINAVWTLARIDDRKAREAIYGLFQKSRPEDPVVQVALRSLGLWRDVNAIEGRLSENHHTMMAVFDSLGSSNPFVQRVAVETLARVNSRGANSPLLRLLEKKPLDPILESSIIHTLIASGDSPSVRKALQSSVPAVRRAGLIVLDQLPDGKLTATEVTEALSIPDSSLNEAAQWILARHPEWSESLAGYFGERLRGGLSDETSRTDLARQIARHARGRPIQDVLTSMLTNASASRFARDTALKALSQAGLKETPSGWRDGVTAILLGDDSQLTQQAIRAVRNLAFPKDSGAAIGEALLRIGGNPSVREETRLNALAAIPAGIPGLSNELFAFVLARLNPDEPVSARSSAAVVLARTTLTADQKRSLADSMKTMGPLEIPKMIGLFQRETDETLGRRLVAALAEAKPAGLREDLVRSAIAAFPAAVQRDAEPLLLRLNADAGKQKARLESLLSEVRNNGDIRRGQAIFNSAKAACSACHAIGYQGGKVGPDLTRISEVRSEKDLLEAIVYPSASFVRSYEPMIVATKDGEEHSGVLRRDDPDEVLLATGPSTEMRIARAEITEMRPGTVSVMPQGLDEQLSRQELADLLAFLKNTRWGPR